MPDSINPAVPQRILVVDDEPDITALVAYHLAKEGYRVTTAGTGADALRSAREERPDMVVLDLMLPGHSGFEVLAELRRRDETRDVGVLLLTARKDEPDRIKGLTLGADDYLAKPFSPKELVLRVGAIPRRHRDLPRARAAAAHETRHAALREHRVARGRRGRRIDHRRRRHPPPASRAGNRRGAGARGAAGGGVHARRLSALAGVRRARRCAPRSARHPDRSRRPRPRRHRVRSRVAGPARESSQPPRGARRVGLGSAR